MTSNWRTVKLQEIVLFKTGKLDSNAADEQGIYPFFTCSPVTLGINNYAFDTEAVLLAGNNANGVFAVKYYNGKFNAYQRTYVITPIDKSVVSVRWLYFRIKHVTSELQQMSVGTATKFLTKKILDAYEVQLPPIEEQERQAKVLWGLQNKLDLNTQTNQTLEAMAQAIFRSWFVDFDPVKAKMQGKQPEGMDADTAALFPDKLVESELGLIPEGWEAKPLGDYLTIKRGGSPRPIKDFIIPEGYPWTKIADATANDNPYIFKTKEFIKEEGLKKTVYLKKGTLILSNSATPGLPRFLELDACIHDGWLHFTEKKHFTDSYLYQLFLHIRQHLVAQGNGSVFTNLKTDILRNQVVLVPPKELVDIYDKHASKLLETVKTKSIESNQLARLRDTLLPKLLSGELLLEQAEKLAEVS